MGEMGLQNRILLKSTVGEGGSLVVRLLCILQTVPIKTELVFKLVAVRVVSSNCILQVGL